jgi:hypothetical protein
VSQPPTASASKTTSIFDIGPNRSPFFAIVGFVALCICILAALAVYASYQMKSGQKSILKTQSGPILPTGNGSMSSTLHKLNDPLVDDESKMHLLTRLEKSLTKNKRKADKAPARMVVDKYDSDDDEDVMMIDTSRGLNAMENGE